MKLNFLPWGLVAGSSQRNIALGKKIQLLRCLKELPPTLIFLGSTKKVTVNPISLKSRPRTMLRVTWSLLCRLAFVMEREFDCQTQKFFLKLFSVNCPNALAA